MSYEFNPENPTFELPNPYKVENLALSVSGAATLVSGMIVVFAARDRLGQGIDTPLAISLCISVALMLYGIFLFASAFTQLRFFFGRNRPANLNATPEAPAGQDGDSVPARGLKETLRQNALTYEEPQGPLNGLLYSWLPHLIFAPKRIQENAQAQFHNFLALLATLISYCMCWLIATPGNASAWVGLVYGAFAFPMLVRPMAGTSPRPAGQLAGKALAGRRYLVALILLAMLGPVVLTLAGPRLPDLHGFSINVALLAGLAAVLAGCAVFGLALKRQLPAPPQSVGVARVADTLTMNAHPNKLIEELDRVLMDRWFQSIPNRRYTRVSPVITGQQGRFAAEILEETQPRPQMNKVVAGLGDAFGRPQFRWLSVLTAMAALYTAAGAGCAVGAAHQLLDGAPVSTLFGLAASLIGVGEFCRKAAHALWGRFDFLSELVWIELNGSFESARLNVGNQVTGHVQTTKQVINVESMTMRVWVSEIDTVIFGKDGWRQLVGMRGVPARAEALANTLKHFGESCSMVVAPTSERDLERARRVGALSKLTEGGAEPVRHGKLASQPLAAIGPAHVCRQCDGALESDARFCGECGHPVASTA